MIKNSCKEVKFCAKCKQEVWSFERRDNLNNGRVEHLRGQCPTIKEKTSNGFPAAFIGLMMLVIYVLVSNG